MVGWLALFLPLISTSTEPLYKQPTANIDDRVRDLLSRMKPGEKVRQLDMYAGTEFIDKKLDDTHTAPDANVKSDALEKSLGQLGAGSIHDLYPTAAISSGIQKWVIDHNRLGIPALFIEEGVHGYNGFGETIYPCSINLAATFDRDLAQATAGQIGSEARANGVDMLLGPVLDVARDPRWGRIEEDFGEDPYLSGALGESYVKGMQGESLATDHTVISEPKHFAGHGAPEGGINTSPVHAGERETRTILLRSFEPAIREGHARGVMAAYHEIDGVPCAGNPWLLTTVLRDEWGFQGFVLSDLGAIAELYDRHHVAATPADAAILAVRSGVDMQFYDFDHATFQNALIEGLASGKISKRELDAAVGHVLRVKFELGLFDHPYINPNVRPRVSRISAHLDTALRSARESICLLKNDGGVLPLKNSVGKIAVIGPNSVEAQLGDYTPAQHPRVNSLADELGRALKGGNVVSNDGKDVAAAVSIATNADVVVLGLGERPGISGEGSDRSDLGLPDNQERLLEAIVATGKPVILILFNGRPLTISWAAKHVPAILECFYPGELGSQAVAEAILGTVNPSGHLPISFPESVGAIPVFYNHDSSKGDNYVDGSAKPLWPFGFGLSYTNFQFGNVTVKPDSTGATVSAEVSNIGSLPGDEVVQIYVRAETSSVATPVRALKGFRRVTLKPGEAKTVSIHLGNFELEVWGAHRRWEVEPGKYRVWVGESSDAKAFADFQIGSSR